MSLPPADGYHSEPTTTAERTRSRISSRRLHQQPLHTHQDLDLLLRRLRERQQSADQSPSPSPSSASRHNMDDMREMLRAFASAGLGSTLRSYDGSTPVDYFLAEYESVCEDMGQEEQTCLRILRRALEGPALIFFREKLSEDQQQDRVTSVAEWKQRLRDKFTKQYDVQCMQIKARKMKDTETASEFVSAIKLMAKQLNPPFSEARILEVLRDNCLPRYRTLINIADISTVDQFDQKLSRLMATEVPLALTDAAPRASAPSQATTLALQSQGSSRYPSDGARQERRSNQDYQSSSHPQHQPRYFGSGRGRPPNQSGGRGRGRGSGFHQGQRHPSAYSVGPPVPVYGPGRGSRPPHPGAWYPGQAWEPQQWRSQEYATYSSWFPPPPAPWQQQPVGPVPGWRPWPPTPPQQPPPAWRQWSPASQSPPQPVQRETRAIAYTVEQAPASVPSDPCTEAQPETQQESTGEANFGFFSDSY